MSNTNDCQLTTKDYTILEVMLEHSLGDDPMRELLRRKIDGATVVFRDDIPPTVVTMSSRVTYTVDDGPAETRIVAHDEMRGMVGAVLSITTARGLALLGLAEGQSITIRRADGEEERLAVQEVAYQPEAARRAAAGRQEGAAQPRPRGPILRLVHSADEAPVRPAKRVPTRYDDGPDDPGPTAA